MTRIRKIKRNININPIHLLITYVLMWQSMIYVTFHVQEEVKLMSMRERVSSFQRHLNDRIIHGLKSLMMMRMISNKRRRLD